MISMRYAWNLSHGNGLVWNVGEYVEGYTNLLMTLVMVPVTALFNKKDAVLVMQILGIPTCLCCRVSYPRDCAQFLCWEPLGGEAGIYWHFVLLPAFILGRC